MAGGCMKEAGYVYTITNHGGGGGESYHIQWAGGSSHLQKCKSRVILC